MNNSRHSTPTSRRRDRRTGVASLGVRLGSVVVAACIAFAALPAPAFASAKIPAPPVNVPSATLITMQGAPLWSRQPTAKRRVASCIKMLNALVVRDRTKLTDVIVVSRKAEAINNGDVGLVHGQRLTVRQLLNIMLIPSANDAAMALATGIAGTESKYVALMNAKAKKLGLKDTHATDPDGLNKHETSTASDLMVLARKVMADPVLRSIVGKRSVSVPRPGGGSSTYPSSDLLLGHYKGMEGVKTGFTNPAGYCFVGAAKRSSVELVGAVLGAKSFADRMYQMRKLLDWGFAHCHVRQLISKDTTLGVVPVANGAETSVTAFATRSVSMAVFDGATFKTRFKLSHPLVAPVARGQKLGIAEAFQGTSLLATSPLVAASAVATMP